MTVAGRGIFVSYRRQESSHLAGRLYDRLADRFGEEQVFMDVDTIGPGWLSATDERGRRRLDDPDDIVRLEIEAALDRGVRVIPILVEGAVMPTREDLRSIGYRYLPAKSTKGGSPENFLRAIDARRGSAAVAYLTPTYLEFTPFARQLVPEIASLPGGSGPFGQGPMMTSATSIRRQPDNPNCGAGGSRLR